MDQQKTGTFIASVRKEKGLTQAELAERLFVSDKTVSKWERGAGFPDIKNLESLAAALGVSIVELMQGEREAKDEISITKAEVLLTDALQMQSRNNQTLRMISYGIAGLFVAISCFLLFLLIQSGTVVLHAVVSLILGLAAWLIPVLAILQRQYGRSGLSVLISMGLSLFSIISQFLHIKAYAYRGDWAAIEDTINALVIVVIFFSCTTILLNSILILRTKKAAALQQLR